VALAPWPTRGKGTVPLTRPERWTVAFFGVRGIGSIYYLAYAAGEDQTLAQDWLWSTVAFTVVASVLIHGILATPVMARIDSDRR
jgi:NhaP-type Na+/H+ or K+/H+ antiporter